MLKDWGALQNTNSDGVLISFPPASIWLVLEIPAVKPNERTNFSPTHKIATLIGVVGRWRQDSRLGIADYNKRADTLTAVNAKMGKIFLTGRFSKHDLRDLARPGVFCETPSVTTEHTQRDRHVDDRHEYQPASQLEPEHGERLTHQRAFSEANSAPLGSPGPTNDICCGTSVCYTAQ